MPSSFTRKLLRVTFTLNNNNAQFPGNANGQPANVLRLGPPATGPALRISATIKGAGMPAWPEAVIKVYGMNAADMNALCVQQALAGKTGYLPNSVLLEANSGSGWSAVFAGNIYTAAPDFSQIPEVPLVITSMSGAWDSLSPATPSSFPGSTALDTVLSVIVAKTNRSYINNGVTGVTSGPVYRPESPLEQLRAVCQAYALDAVFSGDDTLVTVSPRGISDKSQSFTLSPQSGLVGYPQPQGNGFLMARAQYNPAFHVKSPITISGCIVEIFGGSSAAAVGNLNASANGNWVVNSITNTLECETANGAWFSDMLLYPPSVTAVTS
jgi:hypothetical protein